MRISTGIVSLGALLATLTTAEAYASDGNATEKCKAPAFEVTVAEGSVRATAELQASQMKMLSKELREKLGGSTSGKVQVDGRYATWAAAGWGRSAYIDTVESYICALRVKYASDPEKLQFINDQKDLLDDFYDNIYDPAVWDGSSESREARSAIRLQVYKPDPMKGALPKAELESALPKYDFESVKLAQIFVKGVVGTTQADVCGGVVLKSIRRVHPSVLYGLQGIRATIIDWMSGNRKQAKIAMWRYVSEQMTLTAMAKPTVESIDVTPKFLTCIDQAQIDAENKISNLNKPASNTANVEEDKAAVNAGTSATDKPEPVQSPVKETTSATESKQ